MTATFLAPRLFGIEQSESSSDDCYTPAWLFDRMGIEFDIDVCSPPGGLSWIPARRFFTMKDDGLAQPWQGRVWMNPPFSQADPWVRRFITHGRGICLVPCSAGAWFCDLWDRADGVCIPVRKTMRFVRPIEGGFGLFPGGLPIRVAMFAIGDECVEAISRIGVVRRGNA